MNQQRYLIMAGGTGGHIFPALAVAQKLREQGASVAWLGTKAGMEAQLVPAQNISLHLVRVKGVRGKGLMAKLTLPWVLISAVLQAWKIIREYKPCVVVGFGGYVSAPGGLAAKLAGTPLVIHEQNAVAGSTNKLLSKVAATRLEAFPDSLPKATWVGNPIRSEIAALFSNEKNTVAGEPRKLLIMGGSLGALAINTVLPDVIAELDKQVRPVIWHQAGKGKHDAVIAAYDAQGIEHQTEEFIAGVAAAYQWADIIICRSGALTVSEVAAAGVPAIFIPYPHAIDDHQLYNAQRLVDAGAAVLIEQKNLTQESLKTALSDLLQDTTQLQAMARNAKKVAMPEASEQVASICQQLCKQRQHGQAKLAGENNNAA